MPQPDPKKPPQPTPPKAAPAGPPAPPAVKGAAAPPAVKPAAAPAAVKKEDISRWEGEGGAPAAGSQGRSKDTSGTGKVPKDLPPRRK